MIENPYLPKDFEERLRTSVPPEAQDQYLDPGPRGLTIYQRFAFPVIRWFFYGQRASGRSELLAHVIIQEAIHTRQPVQIFDHHPGYKASAYMTDTIRRVLKRAYPDVVAKFSRLDNSVRVEYATNEGKVVGGVKTFNQKDSRGRFIPAAGGANRKVP